MSALDYLLLALIALAALLALRFVRKSRKNGRCSGDCAPANAGALPFGLSKNLVTGEVLLLS